MDRSERAELAVLCLIKDGDKILLQNRVKKDWPGYTLPGGHVECGESFVDAVIREMKEETGLTIMKPKLAGIKQFPMKNGRYEEGRYIVLLFVADQFTGEVVSSQEGEMEWVDRSEISKIAAVDDLEELLQVFEDPDLTEFQYLVDGDNWEALLK
ncbi:MAG: 8-oxo-dGTP diphosphatase [Lachnospiraceae bacterium]|nr:8-oxo-dGTP diphosphatase [Lachnospiraceae bacterium]